ncbi:phosphotransferase family protein [Pseudalkalibacillus caeni]|uniref:Aminoglycoside phosphotransferase family protein n=1 Tax=Exobacillus caeni TaxID=2574798 RepID=A0A5R9F5S1_9BACL|nr:aminoglycoside phosphotransferase family protein [Pseudalkalibacillus caeni]TLS36978.1 aminoglycoside phosphotransferase family protein [Pseudalkalibacillus caeni]
MIGKLIGKGRTGEIYDWEEGKVIKLFFHSVKESFVEQEVVLGKWLQSMGLMVPQVYGSVEMDGRSGIVYEKISGVSMTEKLLDPNGNVTESAKELAKLHQNIHRVDARNLPAFTAKLQAIIKRTRLLDYRSKEQILSYLAKLPDANVLCHGDFHTDNVLVEQEKKVVIDWETACKGNPLSDVARTVMIYKYAILPTEMPVAAREKIEELRTVLCEEYIKEYSRLTGTKEEEMKMWLLPLMAARLEEELSKEEKQLLLKEIEYHLENISDENLKTI